MHGRRRVGRNPTMEPPVPVAAALDAVPVPVLILGAGVQVDFSNAAARSLLLRSGSWIQQTDDVVRRIGRLDGSELKTRIRETQASGSSVAVTTADEKRIILRFSCVTGSAPFVKTWPDAAALLTIDAPQKPDDDREWLHHVSQRFRLTQAERTVLERIGSGATVDEIAFEQGVLASTVRTHLAALFDKTGRRRQSELVRLVLGH